MIFVALLYVKGCKLMLSVPKEVRNIKNTILLGHIHRNIITAPENILL